MSKEDIIAELDRLRLKAFASNSEADRAVYFDRVSRAYQRGELVAASTVSPDRHLCNECGWQGDREDLLEAAHPFEPAGTTVFGCPSCREVIIIEPPGDSVAKLIPGQVRADFMVYWNEHQACPEHSLTTENAAHACWQEAYKKYHPSSAVSSAAGETCLNCGDPSEQAFCGTCREMGCAEEIQQRSAERAEALRLLAAEDERQTKLHDLLEIIREQIRLEIAPEHRPDGLFKNIQDAVYAMRGRTRLMDDLAVVAAFAEASVAVCKDCGGGGWFETVRCRGCNGRGYVPELFQQSGPKTVATVETTSSVTSNTRGSE